MRVIFLIFLARGTLRFPEAPKQAHNTRLLAFLQLSGVKMARSTRLLTFLQFSNAKVARSTRLLAFFLLQVLKKVPEHETVGIFANSDAQKGPGARDCETVSIFANLGAQNGPKVRDCCHFCYFRCLKRPRSTRLLAFLQLCICIFANLGARPVW